MQARAWKLVTGRTPMVLVTLTVLACLGFWAVGRLTKRFQEQQKALARHLYQQGSLEQHAGQLDLAVEHFRAALTYSPENFQYQLSLARTLRDSGRTDEAEAYLISLWERSPQDGAVNLALGRLAVRQRKLDKIIQYYHNAIYGVWDANPAQNRLNAWFELVQNLLNLGARPQAQAELIALDAGLPTRADLLLRVSDLFAQAQDSEHALAEYRRVLQLDRANNEAAAGAGEAAFNLGRYRTAERYLEEASKVSAQDQRIVQMLQVSKLILEEDPFSREVTLQERSHRVRTVFEQAGRRLENCVNWKQGASASAGPADTLPGLKVQWGDLNRRLRRLGCAGQSGLADEVMDLVLKIEQETAACASDANDEALRLLAQNRNGVEQ